MIGDSERPGDTPDADEAYGPLDAAVRLNPPDNGQFQLPPAWVERYGRLIVIRHVYSGASDAVTEMMHPSDGRAVQAMSRAIGALYARGYRRVPGDTLESLEP